MLLSFISQSIVSRTLWN